MVFSDTIAQKYVDPAYENEVFRSRQHYKELHQHNPPQRRNRDFKPVNYGSFRGILNFKHAEPWAIFKNLKDIREEHHNHPIKWAKIFFGGAVAGVLLGYSWFVAKPQQTLPLRKLFQAAGERPWSGRYFRFYKNVLPQYAFYGGTLALSYQLVFDYLNHHETNGDRPRFVNHMIAVVLISTVVGGLMGGLPKYAFVGFFTSLLLTGPLSWWFLSTTSKFNQNQRPVNIFYENNITPEEVERIQQIDEVETLGIRLKNTSTYGYFVRDQKYL